MKQKTFHPQNKKDLEDVPKEVLEDLSFHFISHMDEVLEIALAKPLPKLKEPKKKIIHDIPVAIPVTLN